MLNGKVFLFLFCSSLSVSLVNAFNRDDLRMLRSKDNQKVDELDLENANLQGIQIMNKTISNSCFDGVNASLSVWDGSTFIGCSFQNAIFRGASFKGCKFFECTFFGTIFQESNIEEFLGKNPGLELDAASRESLAEAADWRGELSSGYTGSSRGFYGGGNKAY